MPASTLTVTLNPAIDQTVQLDRLVPGAVHRAPPPRLAAGGKGVNVACVLAALGRPAVATGWLGADNASVFEATFARHGVVDDMLRVPGATRVNLKLADLQQGATTEVNFPGIALDAEGFVRAQAELLARLRRRVQPGDRVVFAGSLPPGLDASAWAPLVAAVHACAAQVVVDVDPVALRTLLADPRTAGALQLAKPNLDELRSLAGRALDGGAATVADAAQVLLCERGVDRAVVSLGADGVVFVGPEGRWHAPAPPVRHLVSTSGAGDALLAGLLAAWVEGRTFPDALRAGMACAAWRLGQPELTPPPPGTLARQAQEIQLRPV